MSKTTENKKTRHARKGRCHCQRDHHFGLGRKAGTQWHTYKARVPRRTLKKVGVYPKTGTAIMWCGPCRKHHTDEAVIKTISETARANASTLMEAAGRVVHGPQR